MNTPPRNYETLRMTPLRKVIAARMQEAKQTIPHYRVAVDIEMDALLAARQKLNAEHSDAKVSVNDFIIKACAQALMECPEVNIQYVDGHIHQYHQADISVVIAVGGGLATPVVWGANRKSLHEISSTVKDLAARAAAGKLKMDEIMGGSFSISNLGMFDVDSFDAIINPPQCAILAVASARPQVRVVDGDIKTPVIMRAALSLDHRTIDGATGAKFMGVLKDIIQSPSHLEAMVGISSLT